MPVFWSFLAGIALVLAAAVGGYAWYAYRAYYRVPHAGRDCVCPDGECLAVDGYNLYVRTVALASETGAAESKIGAAPVIAVHGGPGHSSLSFARGLDFLAHSRRVIYYDQRGSGFSQALPRPQDYTLEALVEELEAVRRAAAQAEKIILVGHSFGGALALRYALAYPQHVEKLVLVGSIRINNGMTSRWLWRWFGPALYATALGLPPPDPHKADAWFSKSNDQDSLKRLADPANLPRLADSGPLRFTTWLRLSLSLVGSAYRQELARLPVPILFVYGKADSPFTGKPVADELCALAPDCRAAGFENSGHWPFIEEPQRFQQVLQSFLGEIVAAESKPL